MKHLFRAAVCLTAFAMLMSCATGPEADGDKAYELAKKATGEARRTQHKTAYMAYMEAIKANPDRISTQLRNRFIEMALVRAWMILTEGSATMEAIPLLMEDIEKQLKEDASPELRQQYAEFIATLGDSSAGKHEFINALSFYDRAIEKAHNTAPFKAKRDSTIRAVAEDNYTRSRGYFEAGQKEKDELRLIRAEYYANVALYYDSTFDRALALLSDIRKANVATYSAYLSVITGGEERTPIFRRVNKYDILLSVTSLRTAGGTTTAEIRIHSNTYNPLRMKSEQFSFINTDGRKFTALPNQRMHVDPLIRERDAEYTLRFPAVSGTIKKLVYENGPHYSEKNFL